MQAPQHIHPEQHVGNSSPPGAGAVVPLAALYPEVIVQDFVIDPAHAGQGPQDQDQGYWIALYSTITIS